MNIAYSNKVTYVVGAVSIGSSLVIISGFLAALPMFIGAAFVALLPSAHTTADPDDDEEFDDDDDFESER
jgi:hypothetical protein